MLPFVSKAVRNIGIRVSQATAIVQAFLFKNQIGRWRRVAHGGRPPWDTRNERIASYITPKSSVLDLGCGSQTLKSHLPKDCEYQPCDLVESTADVIVCDFNSGEYPQMDRVYSFVVCSGVLEYIRDEETFLRNCGRLGSRVLLSYHAKIGRVSTLERMTNHWVSHFSRDELEILFRKAHLSATCLWQNDETGELLYNLELQT